jgi:hypothetical protein
MAVTARVPCTRPDIPLAGIEPGHDTVGFVMSPGARRPCQNIVVELAPANQRFDLSH